MIIKKPQPFPEPWPTHVVTEEIHNADTSPEMQSIPKEEVKRGKAVLQEWMPPQHAWTPPAYLHPLSEADTKIEQIKRWFGRILIASMIIYVLLITSIVLWKLLMIVIALK